jgi:methionyl-tRNA formyltransferase
MPGLIEAYVAGKISPKKQDEEKVTLTRQIKKEDAYIIPSVLNSALKGKTLRKKWSINFIKEYAVSFSPDSINLFIRAMNPWPVAWSKIKIKNQELRIKIHKAHIEDSRLVFDEVQLEGKSTVSWKQFIQGYPEAKFANA